MSTNLIARCARLGWILRPDGDGYELIGNGTPAVFSGTDSLEVWLEHQERGRKLKRDDEGSSTTMQPYYQSELVTLYHGDCLDVMSELEACLFDAVITDEPYGTTNCPWDAVIPFAPMWSNLKRLAKPKAAHVLFGSQPFTSMLIASNIEMFRYEWVWDKRLPTGYLDANRKPLKRHENILVFSAEAIRYNPIMRKGVLRVKGGMNRQSQVYGKYESTSTFNDDYYPTTIIEISGANQVDKVHPTQKPLALMEYLIRTYTNEGDTILDFTCGSGTTLLAAKKLGRKAVGIERELKYCEITVDRLAQEVLPLFDAPVSYGTIDTGISSYQERLLD